MSRLDPIREAEAVRKLRESLLAMGEDCEVLLLDTIEGETSLFEMIDALLASIAADKGLEAGCGLAVADLEERSRRFQKRQATSRALIEQAMMVAEIDKLERPVATLSLSKRAPSLQVVTEADIPAEFWKPGNPTLDRKALLAALKEDRPIPGAALTNAAPSLTVRTK